MGGGGSTGKSKAVILMGGPKSGTKFRPLASSSRPKHLFPVAGFPMVYHIVEACAKVEDLDEIFLLGTIPVEQMHPFLLSPAVEALKREHQVMITYKKEGESGLGTAGGIYKFRGLMNGGMDSLIVINSDICADFPLSDLLIAHSQQSEDARITILSIKARRDEAMNYGNIVVAPGETRIKHYQEKPESVESYGDYADINGGVYVLSPGVFGVMDDVFGEKGDVFSLESDIFPKLQGKGQHDGTLFVHRTQSFWSQIKTAGSAIYANRHYLSTYKGSSHNGMLQPQTDMVIGDVHVDRSAQVDPTAKLGPNVTVSAGVRIGAGVRIRDAILLEGVIVREHAVVLNSIVDQRSIIGSWARVEGATVGVNPDDPTTHEPTKPLFSKDGRLNAQVTILGEETNVSEGCLVRHVICMPHKGLSDEQYSNEIIL